jgi:hypothetical protein
MQVLAMVAQPVLDHIAAPPAGMGQIKITTILVAQVAPGLVAMSIYKVAADKDMLTVLALTRAVAAVHILVAVLPGIAVPIQQ